MTNHERGNEVSVQAISIKRKARRNTSLFTTNRDISILNFAAVVIHVPNETPWVIGGCLIVAYRGLDMPNIVLRLPK